MAISNDTERLEEAIELATDAFWFSIAECYPEIKSGDVSPDEQFAFNKASKLAVKRWLTNNE